MDYLFNLAAARGKMDGGFNTGTHPTKNSHVSISSDFQRKDFCRGIETGRKGLVKVKWAMFNFTGY